MENRVIDISHHNGNPDFKKAKADGIIGVIHKATEGLTFVDKKYKTNYRKASDAGLLWGAYHFATGANVSMQVNNFLSTANEPNILLALDFEEPPNSAPMTIENAVEFLKRVADKKGKYPGLYSGSWIKAELRRIKGTSKEADIHAVLKECWFWLAQYGPKAVMPVPSPWKVWTMWQYTDGRAGNAPYFVEGVGRCDRNKFNGSLDGLMRLWGAEKPIA